MRTTQIVFALILAAFLFFVLKLLGLFLKFALIAAVLGFVVGLLLWHSVPRHLPGWISTTGRPRSSPIPANVPAANSNEAPGRMGVTTSPVSQKTITKSSR